MRTRSRVAGMPRGIGATYGERAGRGSLTFETARPAGDAPKYPVVLALLDYYPPAFRAGGPTRSVPPIVEQLRDEFRFSLITRNADLGSSLPLPGIPADRWVANGSARCLYLSTGWRMIGELVASIRSTPHDVLYVNSIFSFEFSLVPLLLRRFGLTARAGLIIAPRGELDDAALSIKRYRKRAYLWLLRSLDLIAGATWHAANAGERGSIRRHFGKGQRVAIARDIPARSTLATAPDKQEGSLKLIFLGRVARIKNLEFALSALMNVRASVTFNIYGPIEDREYWARCQRLLRLLPPNVTVEYRGLVDPADVPRLLAAHHLLFLPSRGESFGHVIVEAMTAARPVLISDQTPWRGLEPRHAGWDLPLTEPSLFAETIERCAAMSPEEFASWSAGALQMSREIQEDPTLEAAYRRVFRSALQRGDDATAVA